MNTDELREQIDHVEFIVEHIWRCAETVSKFPEAYSNPDSEKSGELKYARKYIGDIIASESQRIALEARIDEIGRIEGDTSEVYTFLDKERPEEEGFGWPLSNRLDELKSQLSELEGGINE